MAAGGGATGVVKGGTVEDWSSSDEEETDMRVKSADSPEKLGTDTSGAGLAASTMTVLPKRGRSEAKKPKIEIEVEKEEDDDEVEDMSEALGRLLERAAAIKPVPGSLGVKKSGARQTKQMQSSFGGMWSDYGRERTSSVRSLQTSRALAAVGALGHSPSSSPTSSPPSPSLLPTPIGPSAVMGVQQEGSAVGTTLSRLERRKEVRLRASRAAAAARAAEGRREVRTVLHTHAKTRKSGETPAYRNFRAAVEGGVVASTEVVSDEHFSRLDAMGVGVDAIKAGADDGEAEARALEGKGGEEKDGEESRAGGGGGGGGGGGEDLQTAARRGVGRMLQAVAMFDSLCFRMEGPMPSVPGPLRKTFTFYARLFSPAKQLVGAGKRALTYAGQAYANATLSFGELQFLLRDLQVVPQLVSRAELEWIFQRRGLPGSGEEDVESKKVVGGEGLVDLNAAIGGAPEAQLRPQDLDYAGFLRVLCRIALFAFSKPQVAVSSIGLIENDAEVYHTKGGVAIAADGLVADVELVQRQRWDDAVPQTSVVAAAAAQALRIRGIAPEDIAHAADESSIEGLGSSDDKSVVAAAALLSALDPEERKLVLEAGRRRALAAADSLAAVGLTYGLAKRRLFATGAAKIRRLIRYLRLPDHKAFDKLLSTVARETDDMINNPGPPPTEMDRASYLPQGAAPIRRAAKAVAAAHARRTRLQHARGALLLDADRRAVDTQWRGGAAASTKGALRESKKKMRKMRREGMGIGVMEGSQQRPLTSSSLPSLPSRGGRRTRPSTSSHHHTPSPSLSPPTALHGYVLAGRTKGRIPKSLLDRDDQSAMTSVSVVGTEPSMSSAKSPVGEASLHLDHLLPSSSRAGKRSGVVSAHDMYRAKLPIPESLDFSSSSSESEDDPMASSPVMRFARGATGAAATVEGDDLLSRTATYRGELGSFRRTMGMKAIAEEASRVSERTTTAADVVERKLGNTERGVLEGTSIVHKADRGIARSLAATRGSLPLHGALDFTMDLSPSPSTSSTTLEHHAEGRSRTRSSEMSRRRGGGGGGGGILKHPSEIIHDDDFHRPTSLTEFPMDETSEQKSVVNLLDEASVSRLRGSALPHSASIAALQAKLISMSPESSATTPPHPPSPPPSPSSPSASAVPGSPGTRVRARPRSSSTETSPSHSDPWGWSRERGGRSRMSRHTEASEFHRGSTVATGKVVEEADDTLGVLGPSVEQVLTTAGLWDPTLARRVARAPPPRDGVLLRRGKGEWRKEMLRDGEAKSLVSAASVSETGVALHGFSSSEDASRGMLWAPGVTLPLPPEHACLTQFHPSLVEELAPFARTTPKHRWVRYAPGGAALFMDLGRVLVGRTYHYRIALRNAGKNILRVGATKRGIPGLTLNYRARPLAPGMTALINVRLQPKEPFEGTGAIHIEAFYTEYGKRTHERIVCPCYVRAVQPGSLAATLAEFPPAVASAPDTMVERSQLLTPIHKGRDEKTSLSDEAEKSDERE